MYKIIISIHMTAPTIPIIPAFFAHNLFPIFASINILFVTKIVDKILKKKEADT